MQVAGQKTLPLLLLALVLSADQSTAAASAPPMDQSVSEQFHVTTGLCSADDPLTVVSTADSGIECAMKCSSTDGCLACVRNQSLPNGNTWKLLRNASVHLTPGHCKIITKSNVLTELCATNETLQAPFLTVSASGVANVLIELLCSRWCWRLLSDCSLFTPIGAAVGIPQSGRAVLRCVPLLAADYFHNVSAAAAITGFSNLSVSVGWRQQFSSETYCTNAAATGNVPPVIRLEWSQPHHMDVCAHACMSRPTCEFFIFNNTGCFEGSLSLYLNSRLQGVHGCNIWHKVRTWASSMLAFYTFNSSMENLVNPVIMPAVNNTPVDIGPEGVLIPISTAYFIRLNLSDIGFDSLVRAGTEFTFLFTFSRGLPKDRSELGVFANCLNLGEYNGAINELASRNEGWWLNSLTGKWHVAKSLDPGFTAEYPNSSPIHLAMALGPTSGYFVVNGVKLDTNFYTASSSYGTDPVKIGCLYLGVNQPYFPNWILNGRIRNLGIFTKMLSVEEVKELV